MKSYYQVTLRKTDQTVVQFSGITVSAGGKDASVIAIEHALTLAADETAVVLGCQGSPVNFDTTE